MKRGEFFEKKEDLFMKINNGLQKSSRGEKGGEEVVD